MDQQEVLDLIEIIGLKKNHAATAAGIPTPRFSEWLHDKRPLTARQMQPHLVKRPAIKCQPLVRKKYLVALPFDFRYFLKGTENNGYKSRDKPQKELKFFNTKIHQTIFMLGW